MSARWRRSCSVLLLALSLGPCLIGAVVTARIGGHPRSSLPPAELLSLGPLWVGDICRDNVARGRHPPGWCPNYYTLYIVVRTQPRGLIYPVAQIPERTRRR